MRDKIITIAALFLGILGLIVFLEKQSDVVASTPGNLPVTVATSSIRSVGKQETIELFAETKTCGSRIISTAGQAIKLSMEVATTTGGGPGHFGVASTTINGVTGFAQLASTTEVYPADEYGCPRVHAFGYESTTTITIAETR